MWYIIIGIVIILVVIGIIYTIFEKIVEAIGAKTLIAIIVVIVIGVIAYFAFSWKGVLAVIGIVAAAAAILFLLVFVKKAIDDHDKSKKETAEIKKDTEDAKEMQENEMALRAELDNNCRELGFMNTQKWGQKLPNYKNKRYSTSFDNITSNFAKQIEQQYIIQNNDWFKPYLEYFLEHPQGATPTKLVNEVDCAQLRFTHNTPNIVLIKNKLEVGTKRVSKDVPPLFEEHELEKMNEKLYTPTRYALKTYGSSNEEGGSVNRTEISFDDL